MLVIGIAYKKDIDDLRESPALDVIRLLKQQGAAITYYDPYVAEFDDEGTVHESFALTGDVVASADCVIITTDHSKVDWAMVAANATRVVDTRHVLGGTTR